MSEFRVIPAIDLLDGQVVRLTQGDYNQVSHYDYTPAQCAEFYKKHGATHIHLVDLNGAKDGQLVNENAIKDIRGSVDCELDLGGGIRSLESAQKLFDLGINKLVLGSLLIKNPEESKKIINAFPGKIIAGIDAKGHQVAIEGWTEKSDITIKTLLQEFNDQPLASIIYTDISRDGMLTGPNIEALKEVCSYTHLPIIASGGVSCTEDIHTITLLENLGVSGCIVGKAILSGKINLDDIFNK